MPCSTFLAGKRRVTHTRGTRVHLSITQRMWDSALINRRWWIYTYGQLRIQTIALLAYYTICTLKYSIQQNIRETESQG